LTVIVADTNLVAHLIMNGPNIRLAERVFESDPDWCAPLLWRSDSATSWRAGLTTRTLIYRVR